MKKSIASWWYCAIVAVTLILSSSVSVRGEFSSFEDDEEVGTAGGVRRNQLLNRPCDEIYVVGEGESLHTISAKCDDPFILYQNPHIQDPDDVFPGLVIKITPSTSNPRKLLM